MEQEAAEACRFGHSYAASQERDAKMFPRTRGIAIYAWDFLNEATGYQTPDSAVHVRWQDPLPLRLLLLDRAHHRVGVRRTFGEPKQHLELQGMERKVGLWSGVVLGVHGT
jgi:hypothetical protein